MLLGTGYSSSLRLPFVSVFVPLVVSNLFPYFSIYCYSFLWVRLGRKVLLVFHLFPCLSPVLAPTPCLSSVSLGAWWQRILLVCHLFPCLAACLLVCSTTPPPRAQCSSFGCFGYRTLLVSHLFPRPSLCLFPTCFDTSLFIAVVLSVCFRRTGCSSDAPCPLSVSVLVVLVVSISCPSFFLSFSLSCYSSFWVLVGTPDSSLLPSVSVRVFLVLSKSYTCLPCSLQVVSLIPSPLLFFSQAALGRMFLPTCLPSYKSPCLSLNCCACLCVLWDETYYPLHYLTVPSVTTTCYPTCLPTCFQLISLSSLHYRASFRVCSMWHGEQGFFPLPFFFPYLFIYSFSVLSSPSLQLLSRGAFGTQDSPCLPCVPICVLIQPIFFSLFLLHFTFLLILLSPLLFLSRL